MEGRVAHGNLPFPLRVDELLVGFWRVLGFDDAFVVDEADDHAAIVGAKKVIDQFFVVVLRRRWNVASKKSFLLVYELHRFWSRENDIRAHPAGAVLGGDAIHHDGRWAAEVIGLDAVLGLESLVYRRSDVVLERAEYDDLALFLRRLDKIRILRAGRLGE